ncbi:MAG: adenosine kinase [Rhodospirillales bacterium]|nr:adenosine kinase [Alphaproteobacteria bacterium]MCB1839863.1 adenosine kinase [Alphaproteobacteria bacterium]MCB9976471.1 adenosine kinase [Rhodospirillales bacterium]
MSEAALGVVAVGNALVDVLAQVDDAFLDEQCAKYGMERGAMTLIDQNRAIELYTQMPGRLETSGGSAANTMAGFASFGGIGAFIGKVADDELGKTFREDMRKIGMEHMTQPLIAGAPTGRCMILVSPDGHRTMNTYLGASVELGPQDIEPDIIASASITYLEGYLFDKDLAKQAFIRAAECAHISGHRVALTLSDPFCVDRHRHDFLNLVQNHVDILFANEEEIKSLYMQNDFEDAKNAVNSHCEVSVLTRSEKGAVIISEGREIVIPAVPVPKVVDTTGAGDQFAAGFLHGFTHARTLEECGRLGAIAAAEVISHIGPRPQKSLKELVAA